MLFSSFCVCVALTLSSMSNPRSQFATCGHERAGRSSEVSEGNVCPSNSQSSFCRNTPHRVTVGPRRGRGGIGQSSLPHSPVPGCMFGHWCASVHATLVLVSFPSFRPSNVHKRGSYSTGPVVRFLHCTLLGLLSVSASNSKVDSL